MEQSPFRPLLRVFILITLFTALFGVHTTTVLADGNSKLPITKLLKADGTLNLSTGYSGTLDVGNYGISLDPARGPIFRPLMTLNSWSGLGGGLNNIVYAIAINGSNVYVGGQFANAGGDPNADYIAKWDGGEWSALGSGLNGQVNALAFNGSNLYVGGNFTDAGGNASADYIAQWNGSSWSTLGNGLNNTVYAITVSGTNVYAGGDFTNAGGNTAVDYVSKLDGGVWDIIGPASPTGTVFAIAVSGATVYIGGAFTQMYAPPGNHTYDHIVYWDSGPFWKPLTDGLDGDVYSILIFQGDVYAAGMFNNAYSIGTPLNKIGRWDGTVWYPLDQGLSSFVNTMIVNGSTLYVGGNFTDAGTNPDADYIARWDGVSWSALGTTPLSVGGDVASLGLSGSDLYAGGNFIGAGGDINANSIALFQLDGSAPTISNFNGPSYSTSLDVPIGTFDASDNLGITGYKITESATPPLLTDSGWTGSPPGTYTVAAEGSHMLYPWVRDEHGNISSTYGWPVTVNVDTTAPTVTAFNADTSSTDLSLDINSFSASDNVGVTGYMVTESSTAPTAGDSGWTASAPTSFTLSDYGNYALYPWARDAAGNVSLVYGTPATGTACYPGNITVTSNADDGPGTLRQALDNICAGNTIDFNSALSGDTIRLNSTLNVTKNVTIDGSALTSPITISGDSDNSGSVTGSDAQVFYVPGGVTATLNGLHITRGWSSTYGGGGLRNEGTAHVINSVFDANGVDNPEGGAIFNNVTGILTVTGSTFTNNTAFNGGAIANYNQLTITNSTFSANTTGNGGGGIYTTGDSPTASVTITNSTFYNNTAAFGGGLWSSRTQTITNSTFSGNIITGGGGAIWQDSDTLNVANTIMANSVGGDDCSSTSGLGINLNNLVEQAGSGCGGLLTADPNLGALADNGGPTQTMALLAPSPAINAGDNTTCASLPVNFKDQRGVSRPNGPKCDIGAYEYEDTTAPTISAFTVTTPSSSLNIPITAFTASDDVAVTGYQITESSTPPSTGAAGWTASAPTTYTVPGPGDYTLYPWAKDATGHVSAVPSATAANVCLPGPLTVTSNADSGVGSLRYAITYACADSVIQFDSSLSGQTIYLASTLTLTKNVSINGSSLASQITLSGDSDNNGTGDVRVFMIGNTPSVTVALTSLTITKGQANGDGGAIRTYSPLTVTNSNFTENSATGHGGAIFSNAALTIVDSYFSSNSVTGNSSYGGAVNSDGVGTVRNSTFSGNSSNSGFAGALFLSSTGSNIANSTFYGNSAITGGAILANGDQVTITNTTISDNAAGVYGGLVLVGPTATLSNTIIANSTGGDCYKDVGTALTTTKSLVEDGSCSATLTGDPNLGALLDNGGITPTMALQPGSPAIDAGDDAICAALPVSNYDQRGMSRPNGTHCDIGAYEYIDTTAPTVTAFTVTSPSTSLNIPITAFTALDQVTIAGYKITESSTPPLAGAAGWTASAPTTYTVASNGSYTLYPWAKDAAGNVSAVYGSPVSVMVDTSAPTVISSVRASTNPSSATSVNFTVTFSEAVFGVDAADFNLTTTGVSGAAVSGVSGTGASYTVSVNTGSGNGTIRLNVLNNGSIKDSAGNILGAAFTSGASYTINKIITLLSNDTQDGWVLESSENSGLGGSFNSTTTTFRLGDDAGKKQYRGILSFNTAGIPDNATITAVTLKIKQQAIVGGGNPVTFFQGFMADVKTGFFTASALQTSDFQTAGSKTVGPTSPTLASSWYSINLTNAKTFINKLSTNAGLTQIRLRFKLDDNNNTVANYLSLFSGNAGAANRPQLVINYYVP